MKKIPSIFKRDFSGNPKFVTREIDPNCQWVIDGEGIATRKWDGTACLIKDGKLYKRYDAKNGKKPPEEFIPCQNPDTITRHWPGWLPVGEGPEDKWFRLAFSTNNFIPQKEDGTFELCGPHFQSNPEKLHSDFFIKHGYCGAEKLPDPARNYEAFKEYFKDKDLEGIVYHHPDGRMAKVKKSDFNYAEDKNAEE